MAAGRQPTSSDARPARAPRALQDAGPEPTPVLATGGNKPTVETVLALGSCETSCNCYENDCGACVTNCNCYDVMGPRNKVIAECFMPYVRSSRCPR